MIRFLFKHKIKNCINDKIFIKDSIIKCLKLVKIETLSGENQMAIHLAHKEILKLSKEKNNSDEVVIIVDLFENKFLTPEFGNSTFTNIIHLENAIALDKGDYQRCALCHNHPGCGNFSLNDIREFIICDSIKVITIVTNNGKVMYLVKDKKYVGSKAIEFMKNCIQHGNEEKVVEIFFNNLYHLGIRRR